MLKILVGFILFAALALFVILKGGNSLDMSGEKPGEALHAPAEAPSAAESAAAADASSVK